MEEDKKPVHGQIRIDEDGRPAVWVEKSMSGNPRKTDTITPDSVRDPQIAKLEHEVRRAKRMRWVFLAGGLIGGVLISKALQAPWW